MWIEFILGVEVMKTVRKNVFETNSSSSHSLTLKKVKQVVDKIPENTSFDIFEIFLSNDCLPMLSNVVYNEMGKLYYLSELIACHINNLYGSKFHSEFTTEGVNTYSLNDEMAEKAFEQYKEEIEKNNWFTWLKEVVKEDRGSEMVIKKHTKDYPFYNLWRFNMPDCDIVDTLGLIRGSINNEEYMKKRFREILYDPTVYFLEEEEFW